MKSSRICRVASCNISLTLVEERNIETLGSKLKRSETLVRKVRLTLKTSKSINKIDMQNLLGMKIEEELLDPKICAQPI